MAEEPAAPAPDVDAAVSTASPTRREAALGSVQKVGMNQEKW